MVIIVIRLFKVALKYLHILSIDISVSDSIGCPPFQVQLEDQQVILFQIHHHIFGILVMEILQMRKSTHTYLDVGFYNVTLSVISHNGCSSDTTFESLISVFDHPVASFENSTVPYCHDEIDVTFYNTSSYETDSVFGGVLTM